MVSAPSRSVMANDIGEGDAEQHASLAIPQGFQLPYGEVDLFLCAPFPLFVKNWGLEKAILAEP